MTAIIEIILLSLLILTSPFCFFTKKRTTKKHFFAMRQPANLNNPSSLALRPYFTVGLLFTYSLVSYHTLNILSTLFCNYILIEQIQFYTQRGILHSAFGGTDLSNI